jgi:pterin-4a-carbinolamine dehydratase
LLTRRIVREGDTLGVLASVVVPTFHRPAALGRALASLLAQDDGDWEAIVVDDGDGEGIAVAEAVGDPRIAAVPSPGSGQADARIAGIARARGELLCWLDDDDWWDDPGHLALLRAAAAAPGFFFRGGWIVFADGTREVFDHDATAGSLRVNNTVLTSSLAYPRALHDELGPLDRELGSYGDWDFMLRMCDAGLAPRRLRGLGVCYAIHDGNVSAEVDAPARREGFERFARKHGLRIRIANHVSIHRLLVSVPDGWSEVDGALQREFTFDDFTGAMAFVNRVAELAEAENHHPDIDIRWSRVTLRWATHSAGAITDRDRELAGRSAALAE